MPSSTRSGNEPVSCEGGRPGQVVKLPPRGQDLDADCAPRAGPRVQDTTLIIEENDELENALDPETRAWLKWAREATAVSTT